MLLEGEIKGAGAPELVRLFLETTQPTEIFNYIPKFMNLPHRQRSMTMPESTLRLTRQFGGISTIELVCGDARVAITVDANRTKPTYVRYSMTNEEGQDVDYRVQSYTTIRQKSRDLLEIVERACW